MSFGNVDEIKKMMELLEKSSLKKLHIKNGEQELTLEKQSLFEPSDIPHRPVVASQSIQGEKSTTSQEREDVAYITSPMVGTFYSAPAPDQPNFVNVGDTVNKDTCVCIIEAMKVMNEVKAGISGIVEEVLIKKNQPIEFGTKIIRLRKI